MVLNGMAALNEANIRVWPSVYIWAAADIAPIVMLKPIDTNITAMPIDTDIAAMPLTTADITANETS
jgi:hypothetical protein